MNCDKKPSEDRRWMQYYPEMMLNLIQKPECTVWEYLESNCPGMDVVAIHYYGEDITWRTVFEESEKCARSLRAMGFGEGRSDTGIFQTCTELRLPFTGSGKNWSIPALQRQHTAGKCRSGQQSRCKSNFCT